MLIVDIKRPKLNWKAEMDIFRQNENKIFQYVWTITVVVILMYIKRLFENINLYIAILATFIIFTVIFIIINVYVKKQIGYYPDSWAVRQIYYLKNGQKNGPEKFYYHSGKINKIQTWQQGKKQGAFTIFYPSGEVYFFGQYKDDVLVQPIKVNYLEHSQRISLDLTQINRDYVNKQQQLCKNYQQEYEELTQVELDVIEDACDAYKGNWLIEVARWSYRLQVKYPKKVIKSVTGIKAYQDRKKAKQLVAICSPWYETACQTTQYHQRKMRKWK